MDVQNPLLQRCFKEAAALSKSALERCIDVAILAMQTQEDAATRIAERDTLAAAHIGLAQQRDVLGRRYESDLLQVFGRLGRRTGVSGCLGRRRAHTGPRPGAWRSPA